MLIYYRKSGQGLVIDDDIHLSFTALDSGAISITIKAPPETQVDKSETYFKFEGHSNRSKQHAPKSYDQFGNYR